MKYLFTYKYWEATMYVRMHQLCNNPIYMYGWWLNRLRLIKQGFI